MPHPFWEQLDIAGWSGYTGRYSAWVVADEMIPGPATIWVPMWYC